MAPHQHTRLPAPEARSDDAAGDYYRQRLRDGEACVAAAMGYLALGWSPLCLCPPDHVGVREHAKTCKSPGKRPMHDWKYLQTGRPSEEEVRGWWRRWPTANVGVALGRGSRLVRVDLEGPQARDRLRELAGGDLPRTLRFTSGREDGSGEGVLFAVPSGLEVRTTVEGCNLGGELRLQAEGAQTVLPPSRHASGRRYEWLPGCGPEDVAAAPAPPWLLAALRQGGRGDRNGRHQAGGHAEADFDTVALALEALRRLGPARVEDYDVWLKVGMCLHAEDDSPEMLLVWDRWSRQSEAKYDPAACADKWETFDQAGGVRLTDLLEMARDDDPEWTPTPPPVRSAAGPTARHDDRPLEADDDPHRLARIVLARQRHGGETTLRFWREDWLRWRGGAYQPLGPKQLRAEVVSAVKAEFDRLNALERRAKADTKKGPPAAMPVTTALVANVTQALVSLSIQPDDDEPPAWLGAGPVPFPADEVLPCRNAIVHLPSLADGRGPWSAPPTPRFFSQTCLPCDLDASAPEPAQWLAFLRQLWPNDPDSINTLREWFGYCLTPDTSLHKILMLVGPLRSGKGTIAYVLRQLVGERNVAAPTFASLASHFGLEPLLGKTLAVVGDARLSGRTDAAAVVERLLSISGEDAQTVDRKHKSGVTTVLKTRFVLLTNELPRLTDVSGALPGRLVVLPLTESFYGREDHALKRKLASELRGILLWAVAGWGSLRARGHFAPPASGRERACEMADLASPVGVFVRENCELGNQFAVETRQLYRRWCCWCQDQGRREPGVQEVFGRDLRTVVPSIRREQRKVSGQQQRFYVGIRVREEPLPD